MSILYKRSCWIRPMVHLIPASYFTHCKQNCKAVPPFKVVTILAILVFHWCYILVISTQVLCPRVPCCKEEGPPTHTLFPCWSITVYSGILSSGQLPHILQYENQHKAFLRFLCSCLFFQLFFQPFVTQGPHHLSGRFPSSDVFKEIVHLSGFCFTLLIFSFRQLQHSAAFIQLACATFCLPHSSATFYTKPPFFLQPPSLQSLTTLTSSQTVAVLI